MKHASNVLAFGDFKNHRTPVRFSSTMYKNNSRDSSKFKGFSPLQPSCNLKGKCHVVGYYSYVCREAVIGNLFTACCN
jgi:hypothetical protein